jgi:hypothetical protein
MRKEEKEMSSLRIVGEEQTRTSSGVLERKKEPENRPSRFG